MGIDPKRYPITMETKTFMALNIMLNFTTINYTAPFPKQPVANPQNMSFRTIVVKPEQVETVDVNRDN